MIVIMRLKSGKCSSCEPLGSPGYICNPGLSVAEPYPASNTTPHFRLLQSLVNSLNPRALSQIMMANTDESDRRYRTLESAATRLQKEAKGYLDSLRGKHRGKRIERT